MTLKIICLLALAPYFLLPDLDPSFLQAILVSWLPPESIHQTWGDGLLCPSRGLLDSLGRLHHPRIHLLRPMILRKLVSLLLTSKLAISSYLQAVALRLF